LELEIVVDIQLGGSISYVPYFIRNIDSCKLFDNYRFGEAHITNIKKKV